MRVLRSCIILTWICQTRIDHTLKLYQVSLIKVHSDKLDSFQPSLVYFVDALRSILIFASLPLRSSVDHPPQSRLAPRRHPRSPFELVDSGYFSSEYSRIGDDT